MPQWTRLLSFQLSAAVQRCMEDDQPMLTLLADILGSIPTVPSAAAPLHHQCCWIVNVAPLSTKHESSCLLHIGVSCHSSLSAAAQTVGQCKAFTDGTQTVIKLHKPRSVRGSLHGIRDMFLAMIGEVPALQCPSQCPHAKELCLAWQPSLHRVSAQLRQDGQSWSRKHSLRVWKVPPMWSLFAWLKPLTRSMP